MIYQTGTITTTAGQTKIKGTGTRWKDNLAGISEGCPISYLINNVVYFNNVLSVNSDTEINLTYPVPVAATAAKYLIATFVLDSMSDGVRKMLANQQYIQYFLRNMDTWMTQDGIVEIKTPTGETVKLESIIALKKLIDGKLSITGGVITKNSDALTLKNQSDKQALLMRFKKADGTDRGFIGNPSDLDRFSIVNNITGKSLTLLEDGRLTYDGRDVMRIGDYGFGGVAITVPAGTGYDGITTTGVLKGSGVPGTPPDSLPWGSVLHLQRESGRATQLGFWKGNIATRSQLNGVWDDGWVYAYTQANTTKDANGNLKAASPVIKVYSDHIELNDESEGVELEKLGTGRYKLKGTLGMNSDASWGGIHGGLVVPNGINNLPLVWADFEVLPDGDIIIETRYRKHTLHPRLEAQRLMTYPEFLDENNVEREDYDYCDIPNGHWIDVRVNMPSDSIYNQKLAEAERLAKLEAERLAEEEAKRAAEEAERAEQEATERKQYDLGDNDTLL